MEPMKPMTWMASMAPMKPLEPMKPMEPMSFGDAWWPADFGEPSSTGSQNGMRYAVFPQKRRLFIERGGEVTTYDTGEHHINGVSQRDSHDQSLVFTSQDGEVDLDALEQIR